MTWRELTLGAALGENGGFIQTGPFGSSLHAHDYVESGTPVVMPRDLGENVIENANLVRVSSSDATRLSRHQLQLDDIIHSRRGDVTRRALVRDEQVGWLCGTGCLLIRTGSAGVHDARFVSMALGQGTARVWITAHAVGATMLNLNTDILGRVPLLLPPVSEQKAIAEVLGALDDKIAANRNVERLVAEVLETESASKWFDLKVSHSDLVAATDYFDIGASPAGEGAVPGRAFMEMKNVPESGFGMTTWVDRESATGPRFINGDTLVARITPCLENRKTGFVDFLADGETAAGSTELVVVRSRQPLVAPMSYLFAVSDAFRSYAIRHMSGTSGRQRVAAKDLRQFTMPQPDPLWLSDFGARATALFEQSRSLRQEASTLTQMRDTLLPALMSGKLRVRDAEKAVEEVL